MIHKTIISSLAITFLCYKLLIIINKRKTYCSGHIQRSVLLCQLLSKQWIRLQTWVACHISPPPPSPLVSLSWLRGPGWPERGRGHCWSIPRSYALAGVSHGYDPSQYDRALSHLDGSPFTSITSKGTPLQAHWSQSAVFLCGNGGGEEGGMTHERGVIDWGEGLGNHVCKWSSLLLLLL
jgi:hypothetical protein